MVLAGAIRVGARIAKFNRKYQYLNPTDKFIRKFVPPNYRAKATRFARYAEAGSFGGLAYEIAQDLLSDGTSDPNAFQKRNVKYPARKQNKTYSGRRRYSRHARKRKHCPPCRCRNNSY